MGSEPFPCILRLRMRSRNEFAVGWLGAIALGTGLVCLGCGDSTPSPEEARDPESLETMREIFSALQVALPASVDLDRFQDPSQREEIGAALAALAMNTGALAQHMDQKEAQAHFLMRSVSRDARELKRAYADGRFDRAAFLLSQITENCISCHTRLPSLKDSEFTRGFVADEKLRSMPAVDRAALLMATRRFDEALEAFESLLASSEPAALLVGPLTDYLVLSLRVKNDFERPVPVLEAFSARPDVWTQLRLDVAEWLTALPKLRKVAAQPARLEDARTLIDEGRRMIEVPQDRGPLVHFVVASSILERYIDTHAARDPELAEAYYLLGITEARIGRNYWVTPAPFLLETSIRLAPDAHFARSAYALLEREMLMIYEGSSREELPAGDAQRLAELRKLIGDG